MAGYQVHVTTMEQVRYYLENRLKIPFIIGDRNRIMAADREEYHSYWDANKNEGILFDILEDLSIKIGKMSKHTFKNVYEIDVPLMSWYIHTACHYIVDAHTIWLISRKPSFYKKRLEYMGDLTWNKKALGANIPAFPNFESYKKSFIISIRCINETYSQRACNITFPLTWEFRQMIREIVKYGTEYTIALVRLGWDML